MKAITLSKDHVDAMLMVSRIGLLSVGFATALAPEGRAISELQVNYCRHVSGMIC